jgi:O-antigen/teichoic acid export membrane protein
LDNQEPEPAPAEGLPRRFGANVFTNYAAEVVLAISALIVTPLILRSLGDAAFGVWALAGSAILYLELFELGFGLATIKLVAEDAERRPGAVVRTINTNLAVLSGFGALALVTGLVVAWLAPELFSVPEPLREETMVVFAVLAFSLAASVPLDVFGSALAGYQRYDLLSGSNIFGAVLVGVVSAAVVIAGGGLVALAVSNALIMLAMHRLRWSVLKRILPELRLSPRLVERRRMATTARLSGWFLLRDLAEVMIRRVDLVVVGAVLGVETAAVYAIGAKLAQLGRKSISPLAKLYLPFASEVSETGDRARLKSLLLDGTRTAMLIGMPVTLVLALLALPAVRAWVGPGYRDAATVLVFLAAAEGLFSMTETAWHILAGSGRVRLAAAVTSAEALVNVVASLALAKPLGPAGVALGTLIGVVLVDLPMGLIFTSRAVGASGGQLWRQTLRPHLLPTVVTVVLLTSMRAYLPVGRPQVLAGASLAVGVYLLTYLLTGATRGERTRLRSSAASLRRRVAA